MASFVLLLVCLALGALVARIGSHPQDLPRHLNWWVLYIALPATVLELIPKLHFDVSLWFLAASMWIVFAASWLLFHQLGTRLGWSRGTIGAIVLTAGLCNTSFVGFPLIEALRGREMLTYAAIADQPGGFLCFSIGGSLVAAMYAGGSVDVRVITRRILLFPPFVALLAGLLVALTPGWPAVVDDTLLRLSSTITPIMLFSVGLQLRYAMEAHRWVPFISGLGWKLGLAPLLIFALGRLLQIPGDIFTVTLLEASMAPMISAAILCEQHDLDPPLANMMVGAGILLSFITVPLWNLLA